LTASLLIFNSQTPGLTAPVSQKNIKL